MWTGSPRSRQVIQRDKSEAQPLGQRRTGPLLILAALVAGLSMALAGPALAAGLPSVTNIIPRNGSHFGGTSVTIVGTNLTGATAVNFGTSNAASFTVNSSTQITAVSPAGGEGTRVHVTVTTPERTSEATVADEFRYMKSCQEGPAPEVSSVEPHSGNAQTRVTIHGFRFFGTSGCAETFSIERVFFGVTEALHFEAVNGGLELVATAPPCTGTVDVRLEDPLGFSPVTASDQFTTPPCPIPINHWYQNGVPVTAGEETPIVMFGNEVNLSSTSGLGESNCRTVGGGTIDNPVGGGAGAGRTNSFDRYECKAPQCEAKIKEKTGLEGRLTVTTENNPAATREPAFPGWNDALEESTVGGVFSVREKIGEPFTTFKTPSPPGMVRETEECRVASTGQVLLEAISEGELNPEIGPAKKGNLNGSSAGAPSQLKFNGASTEGLHSPGVVAVPFSGNLKYLGYFHQEMITVKP